MNNSNRSALATQTYHIDPVHSTVIFKVKHLMINYSIGRFNEFEGEINFDPHDLSVSSIWMTIKVASIDTYNKDRDAHLKGPEFFGETGFSTISFNSESISKQEGRYTINGDLSIKARSKRISFPVHIEGPVKNPYGQEVIGITGALSIDRKDFGISFNKTMENGQPMIDDHVKIEINIEATK